MFRILAIFLLFGCFVKKINAQIEVTDASTPPFTPENLITNYFLGEGIKVVSVKYEGAASGVGYFNNARNSIGIQKGIVLTNGFAASSGQGSTKKFGVDATGIQIASNDNKSNPVDPDINAVLNSISGGAQRSSNLSKYTITFIPSSDTLRFRYVFASEEYPEYVCDRYNDVFGFFISGPGMNGPYENNGINIALIPGTTLPVAINNINLGKGTANCPPKFPEFYNNNDKTNQEPVYDGILDVFTAQTVVQPCQVYTIKLIVADVGDPNYDSGVFLEAKSFGTETVLVDRFTLSQDNNIVEGCADGFISFSIPHKAERDLSINCKLIGTATNGTDYKRIPTSYFIAEGDSVLTIQLSAFEDNLDEKNETIGFVLERDVCTRDTFWFLINDNDFSSSPRNLLKDTVICKWQSVELDATMKKSTPKGNNFENLQNVPIVTVTQGSGLTPTVVPIMVTNVSPLQFSPSMIESICVNIQHPWIDDIDLYLIAPNGQFIALSTDNGGSGDNYINTCFSPNSSTKISDASPPFSGFWLPEESFDNLLSGINNPVNGIWKLMVIDDQPGLDGVVINWSIKFRSNYQIKYQWITPQDLSCGNCPVAKLNPTNTTQKQVLISDSYGCKIKDEATIKVLDSLNAPNILCGILTHNSVTFTWDFDSEVTNYEVSLNGGLWKNIGNNVSFAVDSLLPGESVFLSVRGKGGLCFEKTAIKQCNTIPCTTVLPEIKEIKHISCNGKMDGSVRVGIRQGGIAPFSFKMSSVTNNDGIFENLSVGKYEVFIKDTFTCAARIEFELFQPQPIALDAAGDTLNCFGNKDGVAKVLVSGGTAPFIYKWSNGMTTESIIQLAAGTYEVQVIDSNLCSAVDSATIEQPEPILVIAVGNSVSCHNREDGKAELGSISGGTAPYEFLWRNGSYVQSGSKIINLSPGGYTYNIKDAKGCDISGLVEVDSIPKIRLNPSINTEKCYGDKRGMIVLTPTGGNPPFSIRWSNGSFGNLNSGLGAGIYGVTLTDNQGCVESDSLTISEVIKLQTIVRYTEDVKCFGGTSGKCTVKVSGGTGKYNYYWSNGGGTDTIVNLVTGFYYVTITDTNLCKLIDTFFVRQPDSMSIISQVINVRCDLPRSGSIIVNTKGGNPPYNYRWSTNDTTAILTGLAKGTYLLTVTDANQCAKTVAYEVKSLNEISVKTEVVNQRCFKTASGEINLKVSGGVPLYRFMWSRGDTISTLKEIYPGRYSYTVTDSAGCIKSGNVDIFPADSLSISVETAPLKCFGSKSASIKAVGFGGRSPYSYSINNSDYFKNNVFDNLGVGEYKIIVRDSTGCHAEKLVNIADRKPILVSLPRDTVVFSGDSLAILPKFNNVQGNVRTKWLTDISGSISCDTCLFTKLFPRSSTTYVLSVTDELGCEGKVSIFVKVIRKNFIKVPTGFSPNNDGQNDILVVHGSKGTEILSFEIFDRWGERIFSSSNHPVNDNSYGWDGYYRGEAMPSGNYIWQAKVKYADETTGVEKGAVSLLR